MVNHAFILKQSLTIQKHLILKHSSSLWNEIDAVALCPAEVTSFNLIKIQAWTSMQSIKVIMVQLLPSEAGKSGESHAINDLPF